MPDALLQPPKVLPWYRAYCGAMALLYLVLIVIGLTSPCCMLASVPLLIFWIKPDTRTYFGRSPA